MGGGGGWGGGRRFINVSKSRFGLSLPGLYLPGSIFKFQYLQLPTVAAAASRPAGDGNGGAGRAVVWVRL